MRQEDPEGSIRSSSSSFQEMPRQPQEYSLDTLDHDEDSDNQFVTVPRISSDSARLDEYGSEPLLPTSVRPSRPEYSSDNRKFSCTVDGVIAWAKGPEPPHKYRITPWLRRWQTAPIRLIDRKFRTKKAKILLLLSVVTTWFVIFLSILHSSVNGIDVPGYGKPVKLSCTDNLWYDPTIHNFFRYFALLISAGLDLPNVDSMAMAAVPSTRKASPFAVQPAARFPFC